jgi:DNA-binding MarR family transcriptional regulator
VSPAASEAGPAASEPGPASESGPAGVVLDPLIPPDPLDLRNSLTAIVHWADSKPVRLSVMREVRFPIDDIPMFLVVNQLVYRGALRPSDLAETLGMKRAHISKIAAKLEEAGLTTRVRSPGDQRSVLIALTDAGRVIGDRIAVAAESANVAALADWSPEDVLELRRTLARFARHAVHQLNGTTDGALPLGEEPEGPVRGQR